MDIILMSQNISACECDHHLSGNTAFKNIPRGLYGHTLTGPSLSPFLNHEQIQVIELPSVVSCVRGGSLLASSFTTSTPS